MAIVNRDKDVSEQRYVFTQNTNAVVGVSALIYLGIAPCASQLLQIATNAFGLSGSPTVGAQIQRFVVGSGLTTIPLNGSSLLTITAMSTSGMQTQVLPSTSSTLMQLQKGDEIQLVTSTANTAGTYTTACVVQILQDVKQDYGV
jgi:hypothetical protein